MSAEKKTASVSLTAPNLKTVRFEIVGTAPLVIHRFSAKVKKEMEGKIVEGSTNKKTKHAPRSIEDICDEARYVSPEGWDGFNAASIRCAMISACRLVNFKMTMAKMSIFCIADGRDAMEPEYALVRIHGKHRVLSMPAVVANGNKYVTIRPIYDTWKADVTIRYDADQFKLDDVANLLSRAGAQVGIGEGRNSSPDSAGMGWGSFKITNEK